MTAWSIRCTLSLSSFWVDLDPYKVLFLTCEMSSIGTFVLQLKTSEKCQVICIDVFTTKILLRDQQPRWEPHNSGITQSMPWNQYVRVGIFRIDSYERFVAKRKKEFAFTSFFETQRNMWYCMVFKPVKAKHSVPLCPPKVHQQLWWVHSDCRGENDKNMNMPYCRVIHLEWSTGTILSVTEEYWC